MEISNPDRIVFPEDGITKAEVVGYYLDVAERLLPHIRRRPLTIERYPRGIGEKGFMQKNAPDHYPSDIIGRFEVPRVDGVTVYPVIDSREGIEFLANLGVITFHVPTSTIDDPERADWLIWDLDPPPGEVERVRRAARALHTLLDGYGIPTLLMASGSNGYHLRTRASENLDPATVETVTRGIAELASRAHRDLLTTAFRKRDRAGRVFVDWLRNHPHATSVAPWSLRPHPGAPVAVPLRWDELDSVPPNGVDLPAAVLRTDPWAGWNPVDVSAAVTNIASAMDDEGIVLEPFDRFRA